MVRSTSSGIWEPETLCNAVDWTLALCIESNLSDCGNLVTGGRGISHGSAQDFLLTLYQGIPPGGTPGSICGAGVWTGWLYQTNMEPTVVSLTLPYTLLAFFFFSVLFVCLFEDTPRCAQNKSWFCPQGSFLACLGEHMGCWGWTVSQWHAMQMPCLLHSNLTVLHSVILLFVWLFFIWGEAHLGCLWVIPDYACRNHSYRSKRCTGLNPGSLNAQQSPCCTISLVPTFCNFSWS